MASVSGVRGIVGDSLTPEVIARFSGALAGWLHEHGNGSRAVVLGRDGRAGGEVAAQVAAGALRTAGLRVIDLGVAMTATVGFMVKRHAAAGGLAITASHNPEEWNGLKPITARGSAPAPHEADEILRRFRAGECAWAPRTQLGALDADDSAAHAHVAAVLEAIDRVCPVAKIAAKKYAVALDAVNASGSLAGPMLLEALGCRVERFACDGTGLFPHTPEPTEPNLRDFASFVRTAGVDVGFAQDPDADRLALIDEHGVYIGEEYTLVLAALALIRPHRSRDDTRRVAVNLSTSRMIDDFGQANGAAVVRTAVGEANVVAGMRAHQCMLGGEGNGGVIWPEIVEIRDSLAGIALTLAHLTDDGRSLSQVVAGLPSYSIIKRKAPIREGLVAAAVNGLKGHFPNARKDEQDGLRLDFADPPSWVHVRASNTEPILRVIAEAPTAEHAQRLADEVSALVTAL